MSLPTQLIIADVLERTPLTMLGNLPCPFCGGINLSNIRAKKGSKTSWIECETCGATGPQSARAVTEAHWNKRAFGPEIFIRPADLDRIMKIVEASKS
ncbi:MAG: Lar family restriction alleviation protein [Prosthecobacter sp.]|uniref:Lar family restriction alleviation protein n=1 Tax=Prosthecobacter sp. TaxID=1965333 RepID=UPI003BB11E68